MTLQLKLSRGFEQQSNKKQRLKKPGKIVQKALTGYAF
jgi:hypothetical protein